MTSLILSLAHVWIYTLLVCLLCFENCHTRQCCNILPRRNQFRQCRDACDEVSVPPLVLMVWLSAGPMQQLEKFAQVYQHCPVRDLVDFWQCISTSYPILEEVEHWEGRVCCELARTTDCRLACQSGKRVSDLVSSCPEQREAQLYNCVVKQTGSHVCCRNAYSSQCRATCRGIYVSEWPLSAAQTENLEELCRNADQLIPRCVMNTTTPITVTTQSSLSLKCCEKGANSQCQRTCLNAHSALQSQEQLIQTLIADCGNPNPSDAMWQCFLSAGETNDRPDQVDTAIIDGASIQCCARASTSQCRNLCVQSYQRGMRNLASSWEEFESLCRFNPLEGEMMSCLREVEEPCITGCDGLRFCSNFNKRTTTSFRMCNKQADDAARKSFGSWLSKRVISLPKLDVPIKDVSQCEPDMWKAISCALQVRPCDPRSHSNKICKSDCLFILGKCVDHTVMNYDISALCDMLPVSNNEEECISLKQFTASVTPQLITPCMPNPCNSSHICEVNHCKNTEQANCKSHTCTKACPVGDSSPLLMKNKFFVRMPDNSASSPLACHKVCKCGHRGFLSHCGQTLCTREDSCFPSKDSIVEHGAKYEQDCNQCICHSGENICSRRACPSSRVYTGLPAGCQSIYMPVCTVTGQVYPNPCTAQQAGFGEAQYYYGNCASRNPCGNNPCNAGYKCVPKRRVCLSGTSSCVQYECSPPSCDSHTHDPVCDTQGEQHNNICTMLSKRRQLSYRGRCLQHCQHHTAVCGVDGETYMNECSAYAAGVLVDYHSHCSDVPEINRNGVTCSNVICTRSIPAWCTPINLPGACCPVCGSMLKMLYSSTHVDRTIEKSRIDNMSPSDIAVHLRHFLSGPQCDVFAHLTIEGEVAVIVTPISAQPSQIQAESCQVDAQRLRYLFETRSPLLYSDAVLSILLRSSYYSSSIINIEAVHSSSTQLSGKSVVHPLTLSLLYILWR